MGAPDSGKVAVVTGGSRGLGQVLVQRLLQDGWRVATCSRSATTFVKDTLAERGDDFFWAAADLAEPQTLRDFVTGVTRRFDRIDLLVNNAAVLHQQLFLTMPPRQIAELVTTNLVAPITLAQACGRAMSRHGAGGHIINVSSINAIRG
ncbi:MAG: SDR family NAD(P)-dependent oxidoreductase, partial [Pseudonocardiaceae bacterium]